MSKNPLPWLSIPTLLAFLAYLGCQPEQVLREVEGRVAQVVTERIDNVFNGSFANTGPGSQTPWNGQAGGGNSGWGSNPAASYPPPSSGGYTGFDKYRNGVSTQPSGGYLPTSTANPWSTHRGNSATSAPPFSNQFPAQYPSQSGGYPQSPATIPAGWATNNGARQPWDNRALIIGTFNIQVFGRAKMSNPDVMAIIVDLVRRFDLLAIQELRSTDQTIIPRFVEMLNATGMNYGYFVGPPQGETVSKEQYVYVYDANKLRLIEQPYIAEDGGRMHRSPLVARFQVTQLPPEQAFSFIAFNVHTDPDRVQRRSPVNEISILRDIVRQTVQRHPDEDDFLVLGDFNAPTDFLSVFEWLPNAHYVVKDDWVTNVRENKNFDNIVFNRQTTNEYTGQSGVFNFRRSHNLSFENALQVSDHFPVWGMFSIYESSGNTLARQPQIPR